MSEMYRDYHIIFERPPIPASCGMDYSFQHKDFDLGDNRCGSGPSIQDCKDQIDEQIAEIAEEGSWADGLELSSIDISLTQN